MTNVSNPSGISILDSIKKFKTKVMIYDVDYFISKFSKIPEDKWSIGDFKTLDGKSCANGHCGVRSTAATMSGICQTAESKALCKVFSAVHPVGFKNNLFGPHYSLYAAEINNGEVALYQQSTPKKRILAALYDIKKMLSKGQEVQECDATKMSKDGDVGKTKIIHHYHKVTVDSSIETKELILS